MTKKAFNFQGSGVHRRLRVAVFRRDNFTCQHCGKGGPHLDPGPGWDGRYGIWFWELDHIVPRLLGGTTTEDNLQVLCQSCNARKGARPDLNRTTETS